MVRAVGKTRIHSNWSSDGGTLTFTRDDASVGGFAYGDNGSGMDSRWNGETSSAYAQWIASSDTFYVATSAKVNFAGVFNVAGATSIDGAVVANSTLTVKGAGSFGSGLTVASQGFVASGTAVFNSTLMASGALTCASGATFSTASVTGAFVAKGGLSVTSGAVTFASVVTFSDVTTFSNSVALDGNMTINDTNFILSASTGTKIGTASTQKLGFFNATPAIQATKVASTGLASTMAIAIIHRLETLGLFSATA